MTTTATTIATIAVPITANVFGLGRLFVVIVKSVNAVCGAGGGKTVVAAVARLKLALVECGRGPVTTSLGTDPEPSFTVPAS